MTDRTDRPDDPRDTDLSALLSDAVSDIEPRDQLHAIRNRTKVTPMSARKNTGRPWRFAVGGAVLATAAVITVIALAGGNLGLTGSDEPEVAGQSRSPRPDKPTNTDSTPPASADTMTVAGYYLGETPRGPRLYREFSEVEASDPFAGALVALQSTPSDPDYSTPWPEDAFEGVSFDGVGADGLIQVRMSDDSLRDRPTGMSADEAELAIQQVVYTLQAALQDRAPVGFFVDGERAEQIFGVPTSEPVTNSDQLDVLSLVSITDPAEGASVSGTFTARGVASSFEATVPWEVRDGDTVVASGYSTAEGWMDKLYPWATTVDLSDLAPGTYTFVAMTDDPSGGEGGGPFVDTRTITVG